MHAIVKERKPSVLSSFQRQQGRRDALKGVVIEAHGRRTPGLRLNPRDDRNHRDSPARALKRKAASRIGQQPRELRRPEDLEISDEA